MDRNETILIAGARLAAKHGAANVTRRMVAQATNLPESVVSYYAGSSADAQALYAKRARKLKLTLPDKATTQALGVKLRAHGPRKAAKAPARKLAMREVRAIVRKAVAPKPKVAADTVPEQAIEGNQARKVINRKPRPAENKSMPGPAENKARLPIAPPTIPESGPVV